MCKKNIYVNQRRRGKEEPEQIHQAKHIKRYNFILRVLRETLIKAVFKLIVETIIKEIIKSIME